MAITDLVPVSQKSDISPVKRKKARAGGVPDLKRIEPHEAQAACQLEPRQDVRTLVRLLWVTGVRISEALALTTANFDFGAPCVRVATLKRRGPHVRAIPLPGSVCGELAVYFNTRFVAFPRDRPWPWTRPHANSLVTAALLRAGVERGRAKPHALRHGHAFHALNSGAPLPVVMKALGHAHISTTGIYLQATGADVKKHYDGVKF